MGNDRRESWPTAGKRNGWWPSLALALGLMLPGGAGLSQDLASEAAGPRAVFAHRVGSSSDFGFWATQATRRTTRLPRAQRVRNPRHITAIGGGLAIFSAYSDNGGSFDEPWISDGRRAGTRLLRDIAPGSSSSPQYFAALGDGRVVFNAFTQGAGRELWITDLSRRGTRLLRDIVPGANAWDGAPRDMTQMRPGLVIFTAYTPEHGREVWTSDGTRRGTGLLADLNPGNNGQDDTNDTSTERARLPLFTPLGDGRVFFLHADGDGFGLWITDGTAAGTTRLHSTGSSARVQPPIPLSGGRWLFSAPTPAGISTFVTDGTPGGTAELRPGGERLHGDTNRAAPLGDGRVVFAVYRGDSGWEPWITDGEAAGTGVLRHLMPGAASGLEAAAEFVASGDGRVFFAGMNGASTGAELFVTDGTRRGTRLVRNINAAGSARPDHLTPLGDGRALFFADIGGGERELWVTNGTRAGTRQVRDIAPDAVGTPYGLTVLAP